MKKIFKIIKLIIFIAIIVTGFNLYKDFTNKNNENSKYSYLNQNNTVEKSDIIPTSKGDVTFPDGDMIINGDNLDKVIEGNLEIYNQTEKITSNCKTDIEKAKAIYVWVASNVIYDTKYENEINRGNYIKGKGTAISTFNSKQAVCVGFSALYFVMAKDAGLDVRMVAGEGLGGEYNNDWGNHMWNEVYVNGQWINVDTTFANSYVVAMKKMGYEPEPKGLLSNEPNYKIVKYKGDSIETITVGTANYFDNPDFEKNHKDGKVIVQWKK